MEVISTANYPMYQYQPQQMGYQPQMQPMYQQPMYQHPQYQPQQADAMLYCRMVASADEARGVPVDFNGRPMVFPHLSAGRIYVKAFDTGSGSAVFREFRMVDDAQETQAAAKDPPAPMSAVQALEQTVARLQEELQALKVTRRRSQPQEVAADEL